MEWGHSLKADLTLRTRWELFRSSSWLLNVIASLYVYKPDVLKMGSSLVYIQQMSIDGINSWTINYIVGFNAIKVFRFPILVINGHIDKFIINSLSGL